MRREQLNKGINTSGRIFCQEKHPLWLTNQRRVLSSTFYVPCVEFPCYTRPERQIHWQANPPLLCTFQVWRKFDVVMQRRIGMFFSVCLPFCLLHGQRTTFWQPLLSHQMSCAKRREATEPRVTVTWVAVPRNSNPKTKRSWCSRASLTQNLFLPQPHFILARAAITAFGSDAEGHYPIALVLVPMGKSHFFLCTQYKMMESQPQTFLLVGFWVVPRHLLVGWRSLIRHTPTPIYRYDWPHSRSLAVFVAVQHPGLRREVRAGVVPGGSMPSVHMISFDFITDSYGSAAVYQSILCTEYYEIIWNKDYTVLCSANYGVIWN